MALKRKKSQKGKSSSGFGIFFMGLIVGSLGTVLLQGFLDEGERDVGKGLVNLLGDKQTKSYNLSTDEAISDGKITVGKFQYQELLLEEEYVLPAPPVPEPQAELPKSAPEPTTVTKPAKTTATEGKSSYVIQVGSFRKYQDADRVKALLALNGYEAYIQKVTVEGRGDFYRVRLGPYRQYDVAQQHSGKLVGLDYQPLLFRVKPSG